MNRKRLILFILTICFIVAAGWSYISVPRQKSVSILTYSPGNKTIAPVDKGVTNILENVDEGRVLNLALLDQEPSPFKGYRRNIFKPVFADETKIAKQKLTRMPVAQALPQKSTVVVTAPQTSPAQPETAPLARFVFMGFLKKDAQKTIFLGNDSDIILVKKGDKIAGRYEAASITDQALTLIVSDTGDEIVIPLIENQPLSVAK